MSPKLREYVLILEKTNKDLLEALEIALGHISSGTEGNYAECDPKEKIRAAIAKAKAAS
jgi:hypothetical protein